MRRAFRWLAQGAVLVLPALAVYAWQTRDMLPAGERMPAPAFVLSDATGVQFESAGLDGRPAVLYFFAPWCQVCAVSAPQLRWFDRWRGDAVHVVLVALDYDTPADVAAYAARHEFTMPVLLGSPAVAGDYRIRGYPTYYVLDAGGRIAARDFGVTTVVGLWWRTLGLGA